MNQILKFSLIGSGIILFVIGWGIMIGLMMPSIYSFYEVDVIDDNTYNFIVYGLPILGIGMLITFVLFIARTQRCPHCKEIIN